MKYMVMIEEEYDDDSLWCEYSGVIHDTKAEADREMIKGLNDPKLIGYSFRIEKVGD